MSFGISDGICHGGQFNTFACGYDGGDCVEFNFQLSRCKVLDESYVNTLSAANQLPALADGFCNVSTQFLIFDTYHLFLLFLTDESLIRVEILIHLSVIMTVATATSVMIFFEMLTSRLVKLVTVYVTLGCI